MKIHDPDEYRHAIAELELLADAKPGSPAEARRQALIAAVEHFAQQSGSDTRKGKPFGSIPTRD